MQGELEPEAAPPTAPEPEQDKEILMRSDDFPIVVRRADGTVRVYRPGEWPPPGGIGVGNRIVAKAIQPPGGGPVRLAPLDAGPDWQPPPSPLLMLDGGAE